jgi:glycosyltransferase involved in cell wall biosynthesis
MTFSILIAAYNAAPFLPAAFTSIEAQTHAAWELVVVEDGSNDGAEQLVHALATRHPDRRIAYENLGKNRGVAAARNRLLALAQGDAVAFLDADDQWSPGHLADLDRALVDGAALAFSGIELWDGDQQQTIGTHIPPAVWIADPRRWIFEHSFIQTSSCVALPISTIKRTGLIDETLRIGEDRDYWFRALADGGKLTCTNHVTCRYTKHAGSSMTKTLRVASDTVQFYRKHFETPAVPASLRRRLLAHALWIHGRLLRQTDRTLAKTLFREAVRLQPLNARLWPYLFV